MRYVRLSIFVYVIILFCGCGTSKKVAQQEKEIADAIYEADIYKLIDIHAYSMIDNDVIEIYLSNTSYDEYEYKDILDFCEYAKHNTIVWEIFNDKRIAFENSIIEYISTLSLESLCDYYLNHQEYASFISPVIEYSILTDLDQMDYRFVRNLHNCWEGTVFSPQIDSIYNIMREDLLPKINEKLERHFEHESSLLLDLENSIVDYSKMMIQNLPIIIDSSLVKINRDLFDKIFKSDNIDNYSDYEYVESLVSRYLPEDEFKTILFDQLQSYVSTCNSSRYEIIETFIGQTDQTNISLEVPSEIMYSNFNFNYGPLDNISQLKRLSQMYDIASLTAAFATAGTTEIILDAADFAFGFWLENKKTKKIISHLQNLSDNLLEEYSSKSKANINNYFSLLKDNLKDSQNTLYEYIQTNF
jgi:hypothetical protein